MPPAVVVMQRSSRQTLKSFAGGQPAVGDGLQLARMQTDQFGQRGQVGFLRRLAGFLQRGQFRFRQPGRPGGGGG